MENLIKIALAAAGIMTITSSVYLYNLYFPDLEDQEDKINQEREAQKES